MHCIQTLCVTQTDSASVSGTAGSSVSLKLELNNALAGCIGIETTSEFSAGFTNTTTMSKQHCVECGSSSIAPCTATRYFLESYKTPKAGRIPLGHRWYTLVSCPWDPEPRQWQPLSTCPGVVDWATIDGQKGTRSGCISEPIECPPSPCCDPV